MASTKITPEAKSLIEDSRCLSQAIITSVEVILGGEYLIDTLSRLTPTKAYGIDPQTRSIAHAFARAARRYEHLKPRVEGRLRGNTQVLDQMLQRALESARSKSAGTE